MYAASRMEFDDEIDKGFGDITVKVDDDIEFGLEELRKAREEELAHSRQNGCTTGYRYRFVGIAWAATRPSSSGWAS